jgi:CheY-like chemotaxis protein
MMGRTSIKESNSRFGSRMMKVLFLDDDPTRQKAMKAMLPGITQVYTADGAIKALSAGDYSEIFLDHDLGGKVYVDSKEYNTGMTVAKWLTKHKQDATIVIHSYNAAGARNMAVALKDYVPCVAPFKGKRFMNMVDRCLECESVL